MRLQLIGALAAAGVTLLFSVPALAQTAAPDRIQDDQRRTAETLRATSGAAQDSYAQGLISDSDVTYEQVLQNPDNPALNAAFARGQIKKGDLLGASTTLERILLVHPEASEVRLLYGFVLYRLDDPLTAKAELMSIDPATLNDQQRAERDAVLALLETRDQALRQAITFGFGAHYDSNRNAAPSSETILLGDIRANLGGTARKTKDWGYLGQLGYEFAYDMGDDPQTTLFGSANIYGDRQSTTLQLSTATQALEAGLRRQYGPYLLQASLFSNQLELNGDYYLNDLGFDVKATRRLDADFDVFTEMRFSKQTFHKTATDPSGPDNGGTVPSGWVGVTWRALQDHTITSSLGITSRAAEATFQSNRRGAFRLFDTWLLDKGQFVVGGAEFGLVQYDGSNQLVSAMTRREKDSRYTLIYGVPLGTIGDEVGVGLPDQLRNVVLSVTGEYYKVTSTITNYTYSNLRTVGMLTKRWEF